MKDKKAIVLLSGGLDSATTLYIAKHEGFDCNCLIFNYGQRHNKEIKSATAIAQSAGVSYKILKFKLPWGGSSLIERKLKIPHHASLKSLELTNFIPSTYVPARNIIFLSFAISFAEAIGAKAIFIGAHAQDYSGYPDCRPEFFKTLRGVVHAGTKSGIGRHKIKIVTPLLYKSKAEIIKLGMRLGVPFGLTWSCYQGGKRPCGKCDSCLYRAKGFAEAHIRDTQLSNRKGVPCIERV